MQDLLDHFTQLQILHFWIFFRAVIIFHLNVLKYEIEFITFELNILVSSVPSKSVRISEELFIAPAHSGSTQSDEDEISDSNQSDGDGESDYSSDSTEFSNISDIGDLKQRLKEKNDRLKDVQSNISKYDN